jgi:hypothetical protein
MYRNRLEMELADTLKIAILIPFSCRRIGHAKSI